MKSSPLLRKLLFLCLSVSSVVVLALTGGTIKNSAADFTGREILSVSRIAHGGADYANMQNVTVKAGGFVNAAAFGGVGANPLGPWPKSNSTSRIIRTR